MPAPLQLAYNGTSPAALSTWPGGVGVVGGRIPLRGGGAQNTSVIKRGSVAAFIKMFNGPNTTKRRATTQGPSAQGTEPQGREPIYPNYRNLMNKQDELKAVAGGYRSRKHRRRPTRKSRRVQRKSRRLTRRR